jgi:hypothetical protein
MAKTAGSKKKATSKKKVAKKKVTKKKAAKKTAPAVTGNKAAKKVTPAAAKPKTKRVAGKTKQSRQTVTTQQRDEWIAVAAYYRWEESGCVGEMEIEHWLLAEKDIDNQLEQT